jgi:hypothetical protein
MMKRKPITKMEDFITYLNVQELTEQRVEEA